METTTITQTEAMMEKMKAKPQKEHEWLQKLVGEWTYEIEMTMAPGEPPSKSKGTESVRSIGGLWTLAEGKGGMPDGSPETSLMTLGYDPQKKRYIGTWIGSMMTHMWVYEGTLDAVEKVLTLDSEGPSMSGDGKTAKYQDAIELKSDDHRVLTSRMLGEDGKWQAFVTAHYRRKK